MTQAELLPCPFCGGEAKTYGPYGWYRQWCISHNCKALYNGGSEAFKDYPTEAYAIEAWNTRPSSSAEGAHQAQEDRAKVLDPYEAFERDVPEHLRDDVMQAMSEATGGYGAPDNVYIIERDQIDAINYRAHGIVTLEGVDYTFQMEDGNRNGTELLAWESDRPFERHEPTRWALQPTRELIGKALESGNGSFLLFKWEAILKNTPRIAEIPGKYSYDRFFQPGDLIEKHWRGEAAKHHFDIVTEEEAAETRARLASADTHPKGGDGEAAPFMSGAVRDSGDAINSSPPSSGEEI